MKSIDKFVLVLVASLALLLAGCGGGGSSTTAPPVDTGPTPAEMAISNSKAALTTAQGGLSVATTDQEMLAAYRAIQTAASNLINVLAENGGSAADRDSAIQTLNNATTEISKLEAAIAAAATANAAAIAKLLAGLDGLTAAEANRDANTSPTINSITAAYGKATTVDATDGRTPANSNTKLKGAMGTTMAGSNGWSGTMVTATQDAVATTTPPTTKKTDTVVVYTNIEAPKRVPFGDVFSLTVSDGSTHLAAVGAALGGDPNIQASGFRQGNAPYVHGTSGTTETGATAIRVLGTYASAPGVYVCDESGGDNTCSSQVGANNSNIHLNGPWIFVPDAGAMAVQNDTNYSYFGWWLRVNADGSYSPSTFDGHNADTETPTPLAIPTTLTGIATYRGPTVGKFAIAGFPNAGGHFTADASLSVDFGDDTTDVGTVKGAVTNFMADGTSMPWSVDFASSALAAGGTFGTSAADSAIATTSNAVWTIDGTASATSTTNIGLYRGTFQQNNAATPVDNFPRSATGTWEVPYVLENTSEAIGHMIGAFGVTED